MSKIGDLWFALRGEGKQLQVDVKKEGDKAGDTLGKSMAANFKKSWSGQNIGKGLVQGLGLAGGLGAVSLLSGGLNTLKDGIVGTVSSAIDFEKSMQNVNSIAHLTDKQLGETSQAVLQLSGKFGQSAQTMAEGLYDISSSGFQGADALKVLEAATKGATAGLATTGESAKGVTAVLNAYGLSADKAEDVSDVLFETVNRGVISFPELADQIGKTTALAAPLQVELREVAAAVALMTRNGVGAEDAFTQINAVMSSMLQPSKEAADLAEALGLQWNAQALKANGLVAQMQALIKATGGSEEKMATLLGDTRAIRGAFVLAQKGGAAFTDELKAMEKASGATDRAFAEQSKSTAFHIAVMNAKIEAAQIAIGDGLLPVVAELADLVTENVVPGLEHLAAAIEATGDAAADNEDPLQNFVNLLHDIFKSPDEEARTFFGSVFDGLNGLKSGLDDAAVSINDWWTFWDDHSSRAEREAAKTAEAAARVADKLSDRWGDAGRAVTGSMDEVGDASGKMASDIAADTGKAAKSWDDLRRELIASANSIIDEAFDPVINADRLAAVQAELAAQRRIVASSKSTAAEKRDARSKIHELSKDNAEYLLKLAEAGRTGSKAYAKGIAELKTAIKNAKGPAKIALQEVLDKIREVEAAGKIVPVNIKVGVSAFTPMAGRTDRNRAVGGPQQANQPYWVGERGPELHVPSQSGRILTASQSIAAMSGRSGDTNITVALPTTARPDPFEVATQLRRLNDFGVLSIPA